MENKNKFYVTTPIYYVTARPHLGSLYSTLLADVAARYHKLAGKETFFLTGTDEFGQKIAHAAQQADKPPQEFVDGFVDSYKEMWKLYNLDYDDFIRTTDTRHKKGVQQWLQQLIDQGDIYKSFYTGNYCTPCETFVTEKDLDSSDEKEIACPSCRRATIQVSEECYFFKLSAYQDKLLKFYEQHPNFITPKERMNEVIAFVKEGLKDLSISRTTVSWGIPFPGDDKHVTYVWAEALQNYLTSVGYGDESKQDLFKKLWPADLQILGKDIVRFHAVYWPAFLMASGLDQPKKLLVHGWIKVDDQKMSKSLGNAVDPQELAQTYGVDEVRYYLLRKMAVTQDSEFSIQDIEQSINSELANDLGNLVNRLSTLSVKYNCSLISAPEQWSQLTVKLQKHCSDMVDEAWQLVEQGLLYRAVSRIWEFINQVNSYFHAQEPWKQARNDQDAFLETISATAHSLKVIGILLWPIMPQKMELMLSSIGFEWQKGENLIERFESMSWRDSFIIKKISNLFKKHEKSVQEEQVKIEPKKEEKKEQYLDFNDLLKVDLRVGTIKECIAVEGSEKLLQMQVDLGKFGMRQILAGIKKSNAPESLVGKQAVFVVNLKPRKMMGLLSEGMMMVVLDGEDSQVIVSPGREVNSGLKLG